MLADLKYRVYWNARHDLGHVLNWTAWVVCAVGVVLAFPGAVIMTFGCLAGECSDNLLER